MFLSPLRLQDWPDEIKQGSSFRVTPVNSAGVTKCRRSLPIAWSKSDSATVHGDAGRTESGRLLDVPVGSDYSEVTNSRGTSYDDCEITGNDSQRVGKYLPD